MADGAGGRRVRAGAWSGSLLAGVGAAGVVAASFLPWARSGAARRSSYELVRTAERLDVLDGVAATVARGWYLVPFVVSTAWLVGALGRLSLAVTLCAASGVGALSLAIAVKASPLATDVGTSISAVAGATAVVGALAHAWEQRRHR